MLDFRIDTFLCVCKNMSFTKAALELGMTQPGVSQHIRFLEQYYGCRLFRYANRSLSLTQPGIDLRDAMLSIKHDSLHLRERITDQLAERNTLKFGATLTIGEFLLPQNIIRYLHSHPNTHIELMIANTKELLEHLEKGSIDFAIVEGFFQKNEYEFLTVSNENYVAVCAADYSIGTVNEMEDLFEHNLIVRENGSGTKEILERCLSEKGYSFSDFQSVSSISSIHVIKQLVESGCGITFLYETAVEEELRSGSLKTILIPGVDLKHEFNYIWRKNSVFHDYYLSVFSSLLGN